MTGAYWGKAIIEGGFSIGVEEIDREHEALFGLCQMLQKAVGQERKDEVVFGIVDKILETCVTHFGTEERLLLCLGYGNVEAHRFAHAKMLGDIARLRNELKATRRVLTRLEISQEIDGVFTHHFVKHDLPYKSFLEEMGLARD